MLELVTDHPWAIWLTVVLLLAVIEVFTLELTSATLALGGVAGLLVSSLSVPFWVQVLVAVVAALALLIFARPPLLRLLRGHRSVTNVDALVGMRGVIVPQPVEGGAPLVRLDNGETWSVVQAVAAPAIPLGAVVNVDRVLGASVSVRLAPEAETR